MTTLMGGYAAELADMGAADRDLAPVPPNRTHLADDLAEAVETHRLGIWRYLRFLGCDDAAADDLTQEAFLAIARGGNGEAVRDAPAYLRGVARKLFFKWVRRSRREPSLEDLDDAYLAEADEVWRQFAGDDGGDTWIESLRECVEGLSGRGRQAIDLHYREGHSREQIAQRLEMTADGVKTLLRRTREVLRQCVERKVRAEA
jgi:RNA polymerase sigma-70 factor (ECF subfamily)